MASLKSYARAKAFAYDKRKQNSSIWFALALESLFNKKKKGYLSELRVRAINKRRVDTLKRLTVTLNQGRRMRDFFQQWKEQAEKEALAKDLYEGGQVRLQDANYKSELKNIKDLLQKEGYDDSEITKAQQSEVTR